MREQVLAVKFDVDPIARDRKVFYGDEKIIVEDKKGNKITLADHKRLYPYKLDNTVTCTIDTTLRSFSFVIEKDYVWNGADIPRLLWFFVGSKDAPEFKEPSLIHDYMLEFKFEILEKSLHNEIEVKDYRRISSLTFRQSLKDNGTKTVKSNSMSGSVQFFQVVFNGKEWVKKDEPPRY